MISYLPGYTCWWCTFNNDVPSMDLACKKVQPESYVLITDLEQILYQVKISAPSEKKGITIVTSKT